MISNNSIIDDGASLGNGTSVWHFTHIRSTVKIGDNCVVGSHCYIDSDVTIGNNCKIQSGSLIYHPAKIEDNVFIGPGSRLINDKNPRATDAEGNPLTEEDWNCEGVVIKSGASIGAGSIIMPGVTIGKNAMIGSGSVVTKDVPDNTVAYGVPAKEVRKCL